MQGHLGGRLGDKLQNHRAIEPHALAAGLKGGAGQLEAGPCRLVEEIDADFLQHPQGRLVDRLDLVGGKHLDRLVRIAVVAPRQLLQGPAAGAPLAVTLGFAGHEFLRKKRGGA